MPTRRVLIVDDDRRICALVKRVAEGLGLEALTVDDPVLFDSAYCAFEPDVVFLDLQMRTADGVWTWAGAASPGRSSCRPR